MPWDIADKTRWRDLIETLLDECPPVHTTTVRRVRMAKCIRGECEVKGDQCLIRINAASPLREAIDTLEEEWAHAVADVTGREALDHDHVWAAALSVVRNVRYAWDRGDL
jgi:hypothetical protein